MSFTPPSALSSIEPWEVLDLLASLVQKSLVVYEEDEQGRGRYRFLEPMRQYARDRLGEAREAKSIRGRHRDWYLALAEEAEPHLVSAEQLEWLARLEEEHDNLRMVAYWPRWDVSPGVSVMASGRSN